QTHARPASFYGPSGALGAYGSPIQITKLAAAFAPAPFEDGTLCGREISIQYNGNQITVILDDKCSGCSPTSFDLTPSAFQVLAPLSAIHVEWDF
ncbi:RlpA-like double-psi beta-barrel-protein domain-containing protein-containing protein, partial [Mycena galericulata]